MTFSYQNLDDGVLKRYWSHGRMWLRRADWTHDRRCSAVRAEWVVPAGRWHWSITVGGGDSGRDAGFCFTIPFLLTLYVTVEDVFAMYAFGSDFDRGHDREIGISVHDRAIWWHFWVGTMASWSRKYPWCRWWRQGSFHFASLLGKETHRCEALKRDIPLLIPMPEGVYRAVAKIERRTWKRPLWFARVRVSVDVTIPKGIPFQGKGENSWDCGDDGLYGIGGDSIEGAIRCAQEAVSRSRQRYGPSSSEAIREALSA